MERSQESAPTVRIDLPAAMFEGLALLARAADYASEIACDIWDFGVEIAHLREAGLTDSDFRWLVCRGYVDHAHETTLAGQNGRSFQRGGDLTFSERTCFVLTSAGKVFARDVLGGRVPEGVSCYGRDLGVRPARSAMAVPRWDRQRQQLRLGRVLMKEFRRRSPNQETVLAAFEEEGWPPRIDDPLPPEPGIDPKRRLQDTIKSLNRNQKTRVIRFMGDGSGEGIRWEWILQNGRKHD